MLRTSEVYLRGCVPGMLEGDARTTNTKRIKEDRSCPTGMRLALANVLSRLMAALAEIDTEGCERDQFNKLQGLLIGGDGALTAQ